METRFIDGGEFVDKATYIKTRDKLSGAIDEIENLRATCAADDLLIGRLSAENQRVVHHNADLADTLKTALAGRERSAKDAVVEAARDTIRYNQNRTFGYDAKLIDSLAELDSASGKWDAAPVVQERIAKLEADIERLLTDGDYYGERWRKANLGEMA